MREDLCRRYCPERLWYLGLKHVNRSPLTLSRLPAHLWLQISEKQAVVTNLAFGQTCLDASKTVNEIISRCKAASFLREAVQQCTWLGIMNEEFLEFQDYQSQKFLHQMPIKTWANTILAYTFAEEHERDYLGLEDELADSFMHIREHLLTIRDNTRMWKTPVQLRPWKELHLGRLPSALLSSIVHKMAFKSVSRLRQTSFGAHLVDVTIDTSSMISFALRLLKSLEDVTRPIEITRKRSLQLETGLIYYRLTVQNGQRTMHENCRHVLHCSLTTDHQYWSHKITVEQYAQIRQLYCLDPSYVNECRQRRRTSYKIDWEVMGYGSFRWSSGAFDPRYLHRKEWIFDPVY